MLSSCSADYFLEYVSIPWKHLALSTSYRKFCKRRQLGSGPYTWWCLSLQHLSIEWRRNERCLQGELPKVGHLSDLVLALHCLARIVISHDPEWITMKSIVKHSASMLQGVVALEFRPRAAAIPPNQVDPVLGVKGLETRSVCIGSCWGSSKSTTTNFSSPPRVLKGGGWGCGVIR